MQQEENKRSSLTQPSTSESSQPQNLADEAKRVNKLRMLLNAVKKVEAENQQEEERQLMETDDKMVRSKPIQTR